MKWSFKPKQRPDVLTVDLINKHFDEETGTKFSSQFLLDVIITA